MTSLILLASFPEVTLVESLPTSISTSTSQSPAADVELGVGVMDGVGVGGSVREEIQSFKSKKSKSLKSLKSLNKELKKMLGLAQNNVTTGQVTSIYEVFILLQTELVTWRSC